jgi:O-antigen/teichoic acid export membrane protein
MGVLFAIIQIFGPFVTQLVEREDRTGLEAVLRTSTRWTVMLAAPALALVCVQGGTILAILGLPSSDGQVAVLILAAAFLVDSLTGPIGHVLTMSGRSGLNFATAAAALAVNIGLNLVLIPRWGIQGAAASWGVAIVGLNAVRVLQVRRLFAIHPFTRSLAKPMVAAAAGAAAAIPAQWTARAIGAGSLVSLGASTIAFTVVYVAVVIAAGLERDDAVLVRSLLGRRTGPR